MMQQNDGRFHDESVVLVRYPLDGPRSASDRKTWPWLPGTVGQQRGPHQWLVTIEDRRLAELEDGTLAPEGTPDDDLLYTPLCAARRCYRPPTPLLAILEQLRRNRAD